MIDAYKIGLIGKPHGVKGEMTFMFDDDVFDRTEADYLLLRVDGLLVPFFISDYRFRSDTTALLTLDGIDSQERARELTGCEVFFPRELYDDDNAPTTAAIIGYTLVDTEGMMIGSITAVDNTTANTLLIIDDGRLLIPAADEYIKDINTRDRRIIVQLPEGLMGLNGSLTS